jgi:hypothetical protein
VPQLVRDDHVAGPGVLAAGFEQVGKEDYDVPAKKAGGKGVECASRLHEIGVRNGVQAHTLRDSLDCCVEVGKLVGSEANRAPAHVGHKGEMHHKKQHTEDDGIEQADNRHDGDEPERKRHHQRHEEKRPFARPAGYCNAVMDADGGMSHVASRGLGSPECRFVRSFSGAGAQQRAFLANST